MERFSENTINHIDDVFDEISKFKDDMILAQDFPNEVKEFSKNTKAYLNRDVIYVKKAKRKLETGDSYYINSRAIELCDKAIYINEFNSEAYYYKGKALINLESYDEAINEFITALALDSDYLDARIAIGDVNRLNGDFDDALDVYDSALRIDRNSFEALRGKALVYAEMEDYKMACDFFKRADSINPLNDNSRDVWELCLDKVD